MNNQLLQNLAEYAQQMDSLGKKEAADEIDKVLYSLSNKVANEEVVEEPEIINNAFESCADPLIQFNDEWEVKRIAVLKEINNLPNKTAQRELASKVFEVDHYIQQLGQIFNLTS